MFAYYPSASTAYHIFWMFLDTSMKPRTNYQMVSGSVVYVGGVILTFWGIYFGTKIQAD
jgi:hypothetical protein